MLGEERGRPGVTPAGRAGADSAGGGTGVTGAAGAAEARDEGIAVGGRGDFRIGKRGDVGGGGTGAGEVK